MASPQERVPLAVGQGGQGAGATSGGAGSRKRGTSSWWEVRTTFLAWTTFTITVCLIGFAWEQYAPVVYVSVILLGLLTMFFFLLGVTNIRSTEMRLQYVTTGILMLLSLLLATAVGYYVSQSIMSEYWKIEDGARFSNVSPLDTAVAHADASVVEFVPQAFVNNQQTVGLAQGTEVYCVAPISIHAVSTPIVQYWAVGKNCCEARSGFACDDSLNPTARYGVVIDKEVPQAKGYKAAIAVAMSEYGIASAPKALTLRWTLDADKIETNALQQAVIMVGCSVVLELVFLMAATVALGKIVVRARRPA